MRDIATPDADDLVVQYLDKMGADFGKDRSGLRIQLSDVLQLQEEKELVDDILWTITFPTVIFLA